MGDFGHDFNKFLEIVREVYNKYGSLDDYARGEGVWRFRVFGMYTVTARAILEHDTMDLYDTSLLGAEKLLDDIVGTDDWIQLSESHLCHLSGELVTARRWGQMGVKLGEGEGTSECQ